MLQPREAGLFLAALANAWGTPPPETSCYPHTNFFARSLHNSCSTSAEGKRSSILTMHSMLQGKSFRLHHSCAKPCFRYSCLLFTSLGSSCLHALLFSNRHPQLAVLALYLGDFLSSCVYRVGYLVCRVFHI